MIKRQPKKKKPSLKSATTAPVPSKLRKELDKFAASLPPLDESVPLIRADRER